MKIAIIPARGGSKRIPRKNIKEFRGKPIIAYSIEAARETGLFDHIIVSTEDDEISEIALKYGAEVPFKRSLKNADDFTGPGDVVLEVLCEYQGKGIHHDEVCCIYPTAPLLSAKRIREGYEVLSDSTFDAVYSVAEFSSPILRSLKIEGSGEVKMNYPEHEKTRSQDLPKAFYDAGQFYWFRASPFFKLKNKNTFGEKKGAVILNPMEAQDIDNIEDWSIAEIKYQYLKSQQTK